jgi:hypothetical protein
MHLWLLKQRRLAAEYTLIKAGKRWLEPALPKGKTL